MKKINSKSVAAAMVLATAIAFAAGMQGCSKKSKAENAAPQNAVETTVENTTTADEEKSEAQTTVSAVSEEVKAVASEAQKEAAPAEETKSAEETAPVASVKVIKAVPVKHEHGDKASIVKVSAKAEAVKAETTADTSVKSADNTKETAKTVELTGAAPVPKTATMTGLVKVVEDKDVNVTASENTDNKDNSTDNNADNKDNSTDNNSTTGDNCGPEKCQPSMNKNHGHKGPECGPDMHGHKGPKGPAHDNGHHFGNNKGDHHMDKHGHGPHHEGRGPKDHHEHHGPEHHGHEAYGHQGHHEGPCGRR